MQTKIPPSVAPSRSANDNGPLSSGQVKALKMAIAIMGVLIVAALLAIVARVIYLSAIKKTDTAAVSISSAAEFAPQHTLALPSGATVKNISLQGNKLLVHYENADGPGAAVLDLATGKTLSNISIRTSVPTSR